MFIFTIVAFVLRGSMCLKQKYHAALRADALCYYEPLIFFDPVPLSDAASQCSVNGFTLTNVSPGGQFATAISTILLSAGGACSAPVATSTIALPGCSYFDVLQKTGTAATDCGMLVPVMCVLPAPQIFTSVITVEGTTLTVTTFISTTTVLQTTRTAVFLSETTTFIFLPSFTTSIITVPITSTISFINTVSTTTTSTLETTVVVSSVSGTTTTTTATNFSISQTTTTSTLTITRTSTSSTVSATTTTVTSCPPISYSTETQTSTVTDTVTVRTTVPTVSTTLQTASTTTTLTQSVCGGTANPTTSICCPPGVHCPKLPKKCLSYGQVQTCKHHERKLLVAFRPATRGEAACVCQAVGGALAVLEGDDDLQAAYEVIYSCVGSGGRAWIGHRDALDSDDVLDSAEDPERRAPTCNVIQAISSDFGVVEKDACKSKYPILCRFW